MFCTRVITIYILLTISTDPILSLKHTQNWFPYNPATGIDNHPAYKLKSDKDLYDPNHGIVMGVSDPDCDDGKTHLEIDWDLNPINHTCFEDKTRYLPASTIEPILRIHHIPKAYSAIHKCMDTPIKYQEIIPTFGTHRPLWAKWGEYEFLPKQRWLHNLEHGGIVMLYHPCANKNEINLLRKLLNNCLYRHVITPYNLLSSERPLALAAWGKSLEISKISTKVVLDFIRNNALKGPEQTSREGQYDHLLLIHSEIVSDLDDKEICGRF